MKKDINRLPKNIILINDSNKLSFIKSLEKKVNLEEILSTKTSNSLDLIEKSYNFYLKNNLSDIFSFYESNEIKKTKNFIHNKKEYNHYSIYNIFHKTTPFFILNNKILDEIIEKVKFTPEQYNNFCLKTLGNDFLSLSSKNYLNYLKKADLNIKDENLNDFLISYLKFKTENNSSFYTSEILNYLIEKSSLENNKYGLNAFVFMFEDLSLINLLNKKSFEKLSKHINDLDLTAEKYKNYQQAQEKFFIEKLIFDENNKIKDNTKINKI